MQLRVDSRWHPRQTPIHTMACPSAPPLMLGLQRYTNSAPLVYVASEGNEIMLYDLQNFRTKMKFNAWMPRTPEAPPDLSPVAAEISDMQQAKLPGQVREGMRALLPMPSGGLLCAGALMPTLHMHVTVLIGGFHSCPSPLRTRITPAAAVESGLAVWHHGSACEPISCSCTVIADQLMSWQVVMLSSVPPLNVERPVDRLIA